MRQDQSLLRACQNGDRKAWQTMLDRYERLVYSIPLNFGLSHSDADDVAQATFSALLRGMGSITDEDRLGAWLGTVARRQTWRLVERRRREPPVSDDRLDRVSTEILALDGAGNVESFADTAQWAARDQTPKPPKRPAGKTQPPAASTPAPAAPKPAKRKLTYSEQKELAGMEAAILKAEEALGRAQAATEEPGIQTDAAELHKRYEALDLARREVERLYGRWGALQD